MRLKQNFDLEIQLPHQPRTEVNSMPSPFGEDQTDTPINRRNRDEVPEKERIRENISAKKSGLTEEQLREELEETKREVFREKYGDLRQNIRAFVDANIH